MTDWDQWYACPQCPATLGVACFDLSSGGPQALPPRYREVPHSGRKSKTAVAPTDAPRTLEPRPKSPTTVGTQARRRVVRSADAWRALAEKRRRT